MRVSFSFHQLNQLSGHSKGLSWTGEETMITKEWCSSKETFWFLTLITHWYISRYGKLHWETLSFFFLLQKISGHSAIGWFDGQVMAAQPLVALCTNSINFVPTLKPLRSGPCNVRTRVAKSSKLTRFAFYHFLAAKLKDFGCISSTSCLAQKGTFLMGSSWSRRYGNIWQHPFVWKLNSIRS